MDNSPNDDTLKAHLKALHRNLNDAGTDVDDELQMLLRQLDGDINRLLERRANENADANTYGLASRSQEITARFAARHPHLEPALRELGNILASMGI
jgi:hypothetical protein